MSQKLSVVKIFFHTYKRLDYAKMTLVQYKGFLDGHFWPLPNYIYLLSISKYPLFSTMIGVHIFGFLLYTPSLVVSSCSFYLIFVSQFPGTHSHLLEIEYSLNKFYFLLKFSMLAYLYCTLSAIQHLL